MAIVGCKKRYIQQWFLLKINIKMVYLWFMTSLLCSFLWVYSNISWKMCTKMDSSWEDIATKMYIKIKCETNRILLVFWVERNISVSERTRLRVFLHKSERHRHHWSVMNFRNCTAKFNLSIIYWLLLSKHQKNFHHFHKLALFDFPLSVLQRYLNAFPLD